MQIVSCQFRNENLLKMENEFYSHFVEHLRRLIVRSEDLVSVKYKQSNEQEHEYVQLDHHKSRLDIRRSIYETNL